MSFPFILAFYVDILTIFFFSQQNKTNLINRIHLHLNCLTAKFLYTDVKK